MQLDLTRGPVAFYRRDMTTTAVLAPALIGSRQPLMSRSLALRFVSIFASSVGFFLPLSALPLFAEKQASGAGGLTNGALLLACVVGELVSPWVIARIGIRATLGAGLLLLGAPLLVLLVAPTVPVMTVVAVARGIGFALAVVAGGALTAALIPASRRGEGLAIVGLVAGVSSLVALPLGVWIAQSWGFAPIFIGAAVIPILAVATVPLLPKRAAEGKESHGVLHGLRQGRLMRPAMVFAASAAAAGAVVTYLPLAVGDVAGWVAPAALLVETTLSTVGRMISGRLGDRVGSARLLVPGVVLAALGTLMLVLPLGEVVVLVGAAAFGAGFGILQNATLTLMYARSPEGQYGVVSAIWNAAYDGGMAVGALALGLAGTITGLAPAFIAIAALVLATLAVVRFDRRTPAL
jgi:predicted MFS family arabinose efflux permease